MGGIPAEVGVEVRVGTEDETGLEVSRITGGPPLPKLLTGPPLGAEKPLVESDEIIEKACSGKRVIVVGGRVSVG